ncbi:MAG: type IX secretion system sortase PorU [Tannerella sp.]|nr:type IX secretion system sortase PorU [Tannerella sp.]
MKQLYISILLLSLFATAVRADGGRYATTSALSKGLWVKIRVDHTGIYKITYSDLKKMGFQDPAKVSVHGYGGWPLDEDFAQPFVDDAPSTDVWRGDDYLLFYARGPVKWTYGTKFYGGTTVSQFMHENNPYSMYGYYFVTDATPTGEMTAVPSETGGASLQITTFDDYAVYEKEEISVNSSGRDLFGESFEVTTSRNFSFRVPGITSDDALVAIRFIANPTNTQGQVTLGIDGQQLIQGGISINNGRYAVYTKGIEANHHATWKGDKSEDIRMTVSYSPAGHSSYLDYITLQMKRRLQSYGEPYTFFRSLAARGNVSHFTISRATANMRVFDVTDAFHPVLMETAFDGDARSFTIPAGAALREFVLVDLAGAFPVPETVHDVASQNLHALPQTDMVILAPPAFTAQAERLAETHRTRTKISVTTVTPEQVYNEFSSGTPDATAIRRFMKMFYDRRSSEADAPRFLLLFGDGSYDNRQLTSAWKNVSMENFIITCQTRNSLNWDSIVLDDYFGFLADDEGTNLTNDELLLGIGRFPVRTVTQARTAVDKVIAYMENKNAGSWKNNICYVADDGNASDGFDVTHALQSYLMSQTMEDEHPEFINNRLFFDAFKKTNEGGRATYPDIEAGIAKQFREGTLVFNYTGHGNHRSLSDELVITETTIQQSTYTALPLWITATCDFTPFDGFLTSAGENVFLSQRSGGIGLFSTTRVAFVNTNGEINTKLMEHLFDKKDGRRMTLGEVLRTTKQDIRHLDRIRFALIGDPALTLAYPDCRVNITEINGQPVSGDTVNFRALEQITVKGEILDPSGHKATTFNGVLSATILDSRQTMHTLDNNKRGDIAILEYQDYPNVLQKVSDRVADGNFSFSFVVPKDISYSNLPGKISLYALDENTNAEAQGAFTEFRAGGTADHAVDDTDGPEIRALYLNDTTFVDGGKVNETPFLIAILHDRSGVNIGGSSIGHDVTLTIDDNPALSYNLNAYYEIYTKGNDGEGIVKFSIPLLSAGHHKAELKAWDVLNQSATRSFTFEVVDHLKPFISSLTASPVPARENVTFTLDHNRPESQMTVSIRVYDMTGRLQWAHEENGSSDLFKGYSVTWNLTNGSGARVRPDVYIYRAAIRTGSSTEATKAKKLIVLGR